MFSVRGLFPDRKIKTYGEPFTSLFMFSFRHEIILNRKFLELPIPLLQPSYLLKEIVLTLIDVVLDSTVYDGMINGAGIQKAMTWQRSSVLKLLICHLFGMN